MADRAVVIGSGAGGSVAAMVLSEAGWDVFIMEKGANHFGDLRHPAPLSNFSNDELKSIHRGFAGPHPETEPRTYRPSQDSETMYSGLVKTLPTTVGGGTVHWDAKTPRYWDIDFQKLNLLGPVAGADVRDWPFSYEDFEPFYQEVEELIGVQGDVRQLPEITLAHAPRRKSFVMAPGPPMYSSLLASEGARRMGLHPYPWPMAINSVEYDDRPACNSCGFCWKLGCPIHARVGSLAPLRRAVLAGAEVQAESFVTRVLWDSRRATGIELLDSQGRLKTISADLVVLAGSAIETCRLALLSEFPDPVGLTGRYVMFHWPTVALGIFTDRRIGANRGSATTHALDDFADPEFPGARTAARDSSLPYFRGGVVELGGTQYPIQEAISYIYLLEELRPERPFGVEFNQLMRTSPLRDRMMMLSMVGEDLAQSSNQVDLDPVVRDVHGLPVARITYAPHTHELAAQEFYAPFLDRILRESGAAVTVAEPETKAQGSGFGLKDIPVGAHVMGGMRMGDSADSSVCDATGRIHNLDNVTVADGSVFVTSGAHNPTLTIMATALKNARLWL